MTPHRHATPQPRPPGPANGQLSLVRPRVSIVTPSLNQAPYLEETLRSVSDQDYPDVEHIVMDGGSTDASREIIRSWAGSHRIRWRSGPDGGQADAIQRGALIATGSIFAWLNSDDVYLDGHVLSDVVELFERGADVVTGGGWHIAASGERLRHLPVRPDLLGYRSIRCRDAVLQPATFLRRELILACPLDTELHYVFDWDLFARLSARVRFTPVHRDIAGYRLHPMGKSISGGLRRQREILLVTRRNHGRYSARSILTLVVVSMHSFADVLPSPLGRLISKVLGGFVRVTHQVTSGHGIQS